MKKTDILISIIIPSYNDSSTLTKTLDSVFEQDIDDWEIVLVDDGSTDETKKIIENYKKINDKNNKIKYIYQENKDQLNAIKNGLNYINGKFILILHSDDELADTNVLSNCLSSIENSDYDALIAPHILIDDSDNIIGFQNVLNYKQKKSIPPLLMLWLGRNLYVDTSFCKREIYEKHVYNNYLTWNMPFWLCYNKENVSMLNVKTVNFPFIKYRIHENNYINNDIGKLNVINGELRTLTNLMKYYYIPCYKFQYYIFRIFNKLKLNKLYSPIYIKKETKRKYDVILFAMKKRFGNDYENNLFLNSLARFFKNYSNRKITIKSLDKNDIIFEGSDVRKFNKLLLENKLPKIYVKILNEMKYGFNEVKVSEEIYEQISKILKFLCIYPYVNISIIK